MSSYIFVERVAFTRFAGHRGAIGILNIPKIGIVVGKNKVVPTLYSIEANKIFIFH